MSLGMIFLVSIICVAIFFGVVEIAVLGFAAAAKKYFFQFVVSLCSGIIGFMISNDETLGKMATATLFFF